MVILSLKSENVLPLWPENVLTLGPENILTLSADNYLLLNNQANNCLIHFYKSFFRIMMK